MTTPAFSSRSGRSDPWNALYSGVCPVCDHPWRRGDPIARRGGTYTHAGCAAGSEDERAVGAS